MINSKEFCKVIEKELKDIPLCIHNGETWKHCGDIWKSNCYSQKYRNSLFNTDISILDVVYVDNDLIRLDSNDFI